MFDTWRILCPILGENFVNGENICCTWRNVLYMMVYTGQKWFICAENILQRENVSSVEIKFYVWRRTFYMWTKCFIHGENVLYMEKRVINGENALSVEKTCKHFYVEKMFHPMRENFICGENVLYMEKRIYIWRKGFICRENAWRKV